MSPLDTLSLIQSVYYQVNQLQWKLRVLIMPTLLSLAAPPVVDMTACDDYVGVMITLGS